MVSSSTRNIPARQLNVSISCKLSVMDIKDHQPDRQTDIQTYRQDTQHRDEKLTTVPVNEVKVLILDVILPLIDILVDIAKALSLVFEDQHVKSYNKFSQHFLQTGVYGVIAILLKWSPSLVAGLHFQDMQR